MDKSSISTNQCNSILKLVGDYHVLAIVMELQKEELRFCDLQRSAGGLNPVTLTTKLKKLEEAGIVDRREEDKQCVIYSLSKRGQNLLPVVASIQKAATQLA